jgi:hypothetical protein
MIVADKPRRGYRTIRLPLDKSDYERFMKERDFAKTTINQFYLESPELFPATFDKGYALNGQTALSVKQGFSCRRVRLKSDGITFTIAPTFAMPYMTALTQDVDNPLFLRRFNVPFWALAHVFGRDAMYWYRMEQSLGRFSIVGTTVKKAESLPKDLLADEKHTRRKKDKHYIAMTVGADCILGAEMTDSASEASLTEAYGVFAKEAQSVNPDYAPETVNTDGWTATQNAWQCLFPSIAIILCFLHAFIKIRDRATKVLEESFNAAADKVWNAYEATSKASFSQRLRRLEEWTEIHVPSSPMKKNILNLCRKRDLFSKSYAHDNAHRTSNMVDRLMKFLDRACFDAQYFHGTMESGRQRVRGWAILWNFTPSSPETVKKYDGQLSPAERLNNTCYSANWLENMLVFASMNGTSGYQQNPL